MEKGGEDVPAAVGSVVRMQRMPEKSLANQIHVFSWASIGHMEHAHGERLNRREHLQRLADLFGVGSVQTTEYAHSHLLRSVYKSSHMVSAPANSINGVTITPTLK